jgi:hypothetical protein
VDEILDITLHVAETLETLGVPYLVGGPIATRKRSAMRSAIEHRST